MSLRIADLCNRCGGPDGVQFLLIYIAEAHAYDEWPVGDHLLLGRRILQPRRLEDRLQLAKQFARSYVLDALELLVDEPAADGAGGFDATYAAWPTRFYLLRDGEVAWVAAPNENHEYGPALEELEGRVCEEHALLRHAQA